MNRYPEMLPRTVLGFAAIAMTAVTFAVGVLIPAALAPHHVGVEAFSSAIPATVHAVASSNASHADVPRSVAPTQDRDS